MNFTGEILKSDSVISYSLANTLPFRLMLFLFVLIFQIWSSFGVFPWCTHFYEIFLHQWYVILYECKGLQRFSHFLSFSFYSLLNFINYEYCTCFCELMSFMIARGCDDLVIFNCCYSVVYYMLWTVTIVIVYLHW